MLFWEGSQLLKNSKKTRGGEELPHLKQPEVAVLYLSDKGREALSSLQGSFRVHGQTASRPV